VESPSLKSVDFFSSLLPDERADLEKGAVANTYQPGQVIFYQGNYPSGVYGIESGRVKLYKSGPGQHRQVLRLELPGEILGYRAMIAHEPYRATAEAVEKAQLCFIEKSVFLSALVRHPAMALRLAEKACRDLGRAEEWLSNLVSKSVEARLAKLLLHLSGPSENKDVIHLPLTRADMANWIGTTPESVIRILSRFRKTGLLDIDNHTITLRNLAELTAISQRAH
jgi:CRP-like cAMP-binding protein